jgi:HD-GYP domain-containing protein (c-di-GMP phosphodiesterase class II)/CHASE2 domain-containing sensor protein
MNARAREHFRELLLATGIAGLAGLAIASGIATPLQRPVADALVRFALGRPPAPAPGVPDVAIVALDPQSLRAFPAWPWPRSVYADAIARLDAAGAKTIALDIDFSTPRDPDTDLRLAEAVRASGRVVLAAFRQVTALPGGGELEVASLPIEPLAAAAAAVGSVLVPVDADGIVRRAPVASALGGGVMPSLAAAALGAAGRDPGPVDAPAEMLLDFRRAGPLFPVLSIVDVVDGRFDPREVAGRIVLVGATANEFQDLWSTPLGPARPGVLIQAVALRTLAAARAGEPVLATPSGVASLALCALVSAAAALAALGSHRRRLAALALLALGVLAASLAGALRSGLLLDPVLPGGVLALHYVLGLEGLRRRVGRRLASSELSLSALHRVGAATAGPPLAGAASAAGSLGALEMALALLGDVIGARGVALLRASAPEGTPDGAGADLDGRRIEWRREPESAGARAIGELAAARRVLTAGALEVFRGALPGGGAGLAVYVPLFASQVSVGVLVVERADPAPLDDTELRTLATVGTQLALSAENVRLLEGLRATFDASISAIATAIEARDGYTEAHCRRLAAYSALVAERLGLAGDEIEAIRLGALLHDVGKIGIRDHILLKPGRFTPDERAEMRRHPGIGKHIVERIPGLRRTTVDCVLRHHEWWNGGGYPDGLAGEDIPLGARIVAVVDVWDALSTARPYKDALAPDAVRALIEKSRGVQFDPGLVDLFWTVLEEEGESVGSRSGSP